VQSTSITDVLQTVFFLAKKREEDYATIVVSPSKELLHDDVPGVRSFEPGMFGIRWTEADIKEAMRLYRDLGYKVAAYPESFIKQWADAFALVKSSDDASRIDPYELSEISGILPECHTYVEVFGGGAPMLYARAPAAVEVVNDVGNYVIDFLRVLRDPVLFVKFYLLSKLFSADDALDTDHLREFVRASATGDKVLSAYAWYCYVRQVYLYAVKNSIPNETHALIRDSIAANPLDGALPAILDTLYAVDGLLVDIHGRLFRVQYEKNSWNKVLDIYDTENTLFWVDPIDYGPEKIDEDELLLLVESLEELSGMVAFYYHHADCHAGIVNVLERLDNYHLGWKSTEFDSCTVFTRNI